MDAAELTARTRMDAQELAAPPRLARAVCVQIVALGAAAIVLELPWSARKPQAADAAPREARQETRIRVVRVAPPAIKPVAHKEPAPPRPTPPASPQPQAPARLPDVPKPAPALAQQRTPPSEEPLRTAPSPEPRAHIAADSTSLQGVRMRVLVPRSPGDLAAHLRNSGGCMVVSRLGGGDAEVLSVLDVQGQRAIEQPGPPCNGVPRLLRDPALNAALGDPLGRVRAALPGPERGDELVLQVLLTDHLHDLAQRALRARFGPVSPEEMARRAADSGYELTCFAEPAGSVRCQ
jgi:hypothetical protein